MAEFHYFHLLNKKPAITIAPRLYGFICAVCGEPGQSYAPGATTHPGTCREARRRRDLAKSNAKAKLQRAQAKARSIMASEVR